MIAPRPRPGEVIWDGPTFTVCIPGGPIPPTPKVPSSREIARRRAKAEAEARTSSEAKALAQQVRRGLRPPPGKVWQMDEAGLLILGPAGAIGMSKRAVRTLAPLGPGGRQPAAALMAAGRWTDEAALRQFLDGLGGRLAAVGLRVDRRKAGLRMAKMRR